MATTWKTLRARYPRELAPDEGLRIILEILPAILRRLPWELLYCDPKRLFLDVVNPIFRGPEGVRIKFSGCEADAKTSNTPVNS